MENTSARSLIEYSPESCIRHNSFCWRSVSFGFSPRNLPLARAMAIPSRVLSLMRSDSNSANVARMLKNSLGRVMDVGPDLQPHAADCKLIANHTRVRNGACKAVEFRDNQRQCRQGLVEPWPFSLTVDPLSERYTAFELLPPV